MQIPKSIRMRIMNFILFGLLESSLIWYTCQIAIDGNVL